MDAIKLTRSMHVTNDQREIRLPRPRRRSEAPRSRRLHLSTPLFPPRDRYRNRLPFLPSFLPRSVLLPPQSNSLALRSSSRCSSAMASPFSLALLLAVLCASCRRAGAAAFEVGGDDGAWAVPPANDGGMYNQWASKNRFLVGDTIHFKYKKDSVMEVREEDYNNCQASHPTFFSNNGDTEVQLDRPGLFYYISGVAGHCERGQKVIVKVIGHDAPPPAATPPPNPPSGAAPAGTSVLAGAAIAAAAMSLSVILHAL